MHRLNIHDRRERWLVRAADALLLPLALARAARVRTLPAAPTRVLCLRLERIGDLLMTLPALAALRTAAPTARIDLVVGTWNRDLAAWMDVDTVETLDAAWLARDGAGLSPLSVIKQASRWRSRRYDLALNFEPDIRTNLALVASGARFTAGFASGGGGPLLDLAVEYDTRQHTSMNALALVHAVFGSHADARADARAAATLRLPDTRIDEARRLLDGAGARGPLVGMHVSSGRLVKQWPEERFAAVARQVARDHQATIVLTGAPGDRAQVDAVKATLDPGSVIDLVGADVLSAAAVLSRLDLLVTGDTGPMHLAHAVGTPVVAIFGPSDPVRYGPRGTRDQVVRVDLPCSPCNRIRVPPARCAGHTPDCLASIDTARVLAAVGQVLREIGRVPRHAADRPA